MALLSNRMLRRMADISMVAMGDRVETITYRARSDMDAVPVAQTLHGLLMEYRASEVDGVLIQQEDLRLRLPVGVVTWRPSVFDDFDRDDGTVWKVCNPNGGRNGIWWFMQVRRWG